jgi:hypothetical protein
VTAPRNDFIRIIEETYRRVCQRLPD